MASSVRGAKPKLLKLIEEESNDEEAVSKLTSLAETITADLEKYDKLRNGDFEGARKVSVKSMSVMTF